MTDLTGADYYDGAEWIPLTFGGATPPIETVHKVVIPTIQSNAAGAATDYDSGDNYPSTVDMWHWPTSRIVPASEPTSRRMGSILGMGIGNSFVQDLASTLGENERILIVNTAVGGTGFTLPSTNSFSSALTWDRNAADDGNNLALRTRDALVSVLGSLAPGSEVVAFLANHGSTDGSNGTPKAVFKAMLEDWVDWIRTEIGAPTVPYLMMQMRPSLLVETRHRIIDEAQQEVAADPTYVNVGYATSPDGSIYNKADSVHFNALGVRTIGHSLYDLYEAVS